ncbi:MAG TPA: hypothetical protein VK101_06325 [Limnochordia bacterium]|nr:hypothetical protein [Limnochordia bacterium]
MSSADNQRSPETEAHRQDANSAAGVAQELTRLLHDVADAQMRIAELVSAFWRDLSELTESCEKAAREIRTAAEELKAALALIKGGGLDREGKNSGTTNGAPQKLEGAARRRTIRTYGSYGRGGRKQQEPAAAGQDDREMAQWEAGEIVAKLERLVADAQRLVELLNHREA